MLFQVIHCHPLTDSYSHALFKTIIAALEQAGHQVVATDLYRELFDPTMSEAERRSYYQARYETAGVAPYIDLLRKVDDVYFLLPALVVCDVKYSKINKLNQ